MSSHAIRPARRTDEAILCAAHALLVEQGFGRMSMRCLSHRAGLQAGSIYHHFSGKQEVLEEVLGNIVQRRLDAWRAVRSTDRAVWRWLQGFIVFHVQHVLSHPDDQKVLRSERRYLEAEALHRLEQLEGDYYQELFNRVAEGAASGVLSVRCAELATRTLCQLLDGVEGLQSAGTDERRRAAVSWMVELSARILQVSSESSSIRRCVK